MSHTTSSYTNERLPSPKMGQHHHQQHHHHQAQKQDENALNITSFPIISTLMNPQSTIHADYATHQQASKTP